MPTQIPSTGRPLTRSRSASSRPAREAPGGALDMPDARNHGERRFEHHRRVGADLGVGARALERGHTDRRLPAP